MKKNQYDAVIIGSGPNGLAAAITLAKKSLSVLVLEAREVIGGGARSAQLTLPGFIHDICSAIHPLAVGSPFFQALPLKDFGLEFIESPASLAHVLDEDTAVLLKKSIEETGENLGAEDAKNYRNLMKPFADSWEQLAPDILAPLGFPAHPFKMAHFGWVSMRSATGFAKKYFSEERARALFAGCAAHSMIPLEDVPCAAFGLVLAMTAHSVGWAFPRGGAQKITDAMAAYLLSLDGEIQTNNRVDNVDDLPRTRAVLFDLTPRQILSIAGHRLPDDYRKKLENFKYGTGVFKIDFALSEAIPWRPEGCSQSATVHIGGTIDEVALSERAANSGTVSEEPFIIIAQNSLFDETRAPRGKHVAWAYCHVPNGSTLDLTERIESRIEHFAPGFRDCILERVVWNTADLEKDNANYVGGDIGGGANILSQLFTRPVARYNPYTMPVKGFYICSSSTPPGGGVHGMCGFHAAKAALKNEFGKSLDD